MNQIFGCTFDNELDNNIEMIVTTTAESVNVWTSGPTSTVDHTWTWKEAQTLRDMLTLAIDEKNNEEK